MSCGRGGSSGGSLRKAEGAEKKRTNQKKKNYSHTHIYVRTAIRVVNRSINFPIHPLKH